LTKDAYCVNMYRMVPRSYVRSARGAKS
jgi:hypothetical protein